MSGLFSGPGGDKSGTSGARFWPIYAFAMALVGVTTVINVTSILIEHPPAEHHYAAWKPFLWEISSAILHAILVPIIFWLYRRASLERLGAGLFFALHTGIACIFSFAHVAGMVAIRKAVYAAFGEMYDFSRGNLPLQLLYEGRKDLLTYAIFAGIIWVADRLAAQAAAPLPSRIELKADGRTLYRDAAEIVWVEAAGNYVELHCRDTKPLLLRGTLQDYEQQLRPHGFVRVHRSRLVNRTHIESFAGTSSGDVRIQLRDGPELTGSRRYRANLEAQ